MALQKQLRSEKKPSQKRQNVITAFYHKESQRKQPPLSPSNENDHSNKKIRFNKAPPFRNIDVADESSSKKTLEPIFKGIALTKTYTSRKESKQLLLDPGNEESRFRKCPICQKSLPIHSLAAHAANCESHDVVKQPISDNCNKNETPSTTTTPDKDEKIIHSKDSKSSEQTSTNNNQSSSCWWTKPQNKPIPNPSIIITPTSEPIPGLFLYENFITPNDEQTILYAITDHDSTPPLWKPCTFNGRSYGKRWGVHCNLRDRRVDAPEHPLPIFFKDILFPRLEALAPMRGCVPNEANAIDYRKRLGHYLTSHVDDRRLSKEPIANLSLVGDCIMTFRNERRRQRQGVTTGNNDDDGVKVLLKRRTLQVLTGKARYDYSHGIAREDILSDRRVSITMRESPLTWKF